MLFKRKVDRAMDLQKEQNEKAERQHLPENPDDLHFEKKDTLAMILSAFLVIMPVAIVVVLIIAFGAYFLFFH